MRRGWIFLLVMVLATGLAAASAAAAPREVVHLTIEGVINPIKARYIENELKQAAEDRAALVVISINTPGGLVDSMQDIVGDIVNSPVPVVTFVEPQAAMATSAGTFIVLAGDVAAMAPGTTIGSAHPVGGQGEKIEGPMEEKVVNVLVSLSKTLSERRNRNAWFAEQSVKSSVNLTAEAAKESGVIEILARDMPDLLRQLDGYRIDNANRKDTIVITGATVREEPLSRFEIFLDAVANPTVAYILMTLGVMGLIYEFSSPGVGLGAIVGSICLLLGLVALSALPIHIGGILLIILGFIMIVLEFKLASHGLLTTGGIIALVLGSFVFVDAGGYYGAVQQIKYGVVLPVIVGMALVLAFMVGLAIKALKSPQRMGLKAMVGATATVKTALAPCGMVFADGALWNAVSADGEIAAGEEVVIERIEGTPRHLVVRRADKNVK